MTAAVPSDHAATGSTGLARIALEGFLRRAADDGWRVPAGLPPGPYALRLAIYQGRLAFDIRRLDDTPLTAIVLALGPFRSLIKDYQLLVDSHILAVQDGREDRIQAIDMGRRGLHNEGAELMMTRLRGKVDIDFATARRLFTLICVLHQRI